MRSSTLFNDPRVITCPYVIGVTDIYPVRTDSSNEESSPEKHVCAHTELPTCNQVEDPKLLSDLYKLCLRFLHINVSTRSRLCG